MLPDNSQTRVLVIGDVMLDHYMHAEVDRISQEAPVPIAKVVRDDYRPGGAANVAANCAALGARTSLFGFVGNDASGMVLGQIMGQCGLFAMALHASPEDTTTTKSRVLAGRGHQQMLRLDREGRTEVDWSKLAGVIDGEDGRPMYDVLVLADYGKGVLANPEPLIARAVAQGVKVLVDPKRPDWRAYTGATLIKPNALEHQQHGRTAPAGAWVFVTDGGNGAVLLDAGKMRGTYSARADGPAVDATGAGDTVIATLAAFWPSHQAGGVDAYALSMIAAGISVGRVGTTVVKRAELEAAAKRWHATQPA